MSVLRRVNKRSIETRIIRYSVITNILFVYMKSCHMAEKYDHVTQAPRVLISLHESTCNKNDQLDRLQWNLPVLFDIRYVLVKYLVRSMLALLSRMVCLCFY